MSYDYSYDNNGNITEIKQNGKLTNKYVYDSLNELKEEYDYVNKFYINYSYDGAGNLQNKYEQVLDPNYGYPTGTQHGNTYEYTDTSWKDKLTKVNGSNISYDANGNPLSYRDGMSFEWENGRILKNINTSDKAVQMSYDSNGMRTQKSVDGVKTNYYYDSNKNLIALVKGNDTLLFYYDSDGSATSFSYNGTMYFYVKNLQGDVIRIIDLAGTEVASYVYDAWGNIKDTKVALVDDLVYALIALTAATVAICSTSFFQKGWSAFCNAVGNGLSSIGNAIWNGASATWNWSKNKVKNAINAVKKFNTAVKSANNIRTKLKKERKNNKRFYTITFNSDDVPILGSKLTKSKVESKLRQGKDVITYYKSDALNIANSVGSTRSKCDPKHRGSASFKYYHVKYKNIKLSIHSFYV